MNTTTLAQPKTQLGPQIEGVLDTGTCYSRVVFVSAFTALRTILRLRDRLLRTVENGATLRLTVGIDLGGTSREVLEELGRWDCEVFVYHNPIVRATFHPKIYLFECDSSAVLVIGSNNLTDGGHPMRDENPPISPIPFIPYWPPDRQEKSKNFRKSCNRPPV